MDTDLKKAIEPEDLQERQFDEEIVNVSTTKESKNPKF